MRLEFPNDDRIDTLAHEIVAKAFGRPEAWISNEATITLYEELVWETDDGHELIAMSDIPQADRHLYDFGTLPSSDLTRTYVWYPPYTPEEETAHQIAAFHKALAQIEAAFGVSLEVFRNRPEHDAFVYEVADYIAQQRLLQLQNLRQQFENDQPGN